MPQTLRRTLPLLAAGLFLAAQSLPALAQQPSGSETAKHSGGEQDKGGAIKGGDNSKGHNTDNLQDHGGSRSSQTQGGSG